SIVMPNCDRRWMPNHDRFECQTAIDSDAILQYSLWYELHPFENLRRKGHHCHGLTHLSWAERKIFYRVLGKKFCGLFIYPGQSVRQVVAVSAPGDRDSYGCVALGRQ
ncbi:hypothetical protein, partial [Escherichia coli]